MAIDIATADYHAVLAEGWAITENPRPDGAFEEWAERNGERIFRGLKSRPSPPPSFDDLVAKLEAAATAAERAAVAAEIYEAGREAGYDESGWRD